METTIELPEDLLLEAVATAAARGITLEAFIEQCLRKELASPSGLSPEESKYFEVGPLGLPVLKKHGVSVAPEDVRRMLEEADEEELQRAIAIRNGESS